MALKAEVLDSSKHIRVVNSNNPQSWIDVFSSSRNFGLKRLILIRGSEKELAQSRPWNLEQQVIDIIRLKLKALPLHEMPEDFSLNNKKIGMKRMILIKEKGNMHKQTLASRGTNPLQHNQIETRETTPRRIVQLTRCQCWTLYNADPGILRYKSIDIIGLKPGHFPSQKSLSIQFN